MRRGRVRIELIGDKELKEQIRQLGDRVQAINSKACRAAQVPILDEANALAPGPHIIALQSKLESNENLAVVNIGPDKEHWYYQFDETGASAHEIKAGRSAGARLAFKGISGLVITRSVNHPGKSARPFLRPAMTHNREQAQKIAGQVFLAEINKVANGPD